MVVQRRLVSTSAASLSGGDSRYGYMIDRSGSAININLDQLRAGVWVQQKSALRQRTMEVLLVGKFGLSGKGGARVCMTWMHLCLEVVLLSVAHRSCTRMQPRDGPANLFSRFLINYRHQPTRSTRLLTWRWGVISALYFHSVSELYMQSPCAIHRLDQRARSRARQYSF